MVVIGHCHIFGVPTNIDDPESNPNDSFVPNDNFGHLHLVSISGGRSERGRWVLISLLLPNWISHRDIALLLIKEKRFL